MGLIDEIRAGTYVADEPIGATPGRAVTFAEAADRIVAGEDPLRVARELLDQAARLPAAELLATMQQRPRPTRNGRADALLAAVAEHLAAGVDARAPAWTLEPDRFLDRFWFVSEVPGLRAISLAQSPVALKRRGILWPARSLARV